MDSNNHMLIAPETFAAPPQSLTEQLFIEWSLAENKFWLRIMKEHSNFLGEGFSRRSHRTSLQKKEEKEEAFSEMLELEQG